ncbi:MAG: SLC13 family permease [Gammaproteobacteria bacterium]|nr:SLC13 family permease [Gammaproteobacteria bacterium]MCP4091639.1 SLC13 family permease [Gammaproteobacteria bacterium]MCP4276135.1 SLC13 family permease [Gammaproteobacteria bacterium]MCP4830879.1 SLC13 family permease [Gammaproteobacteria bacterium]MCP4929705.1 SLC13 family permease [Gammaproteobacteria bacterium]
MTWEIALVLGILLVALILFITEWLRMDVVALAVLGVLAITGLVNASDALSGFSNPAVITVWAMFILSDGLTRTGIADILGTQVLKVAGQREVTLTIVIMLTAGGLSAFMNNIGVAALMLPVVVDICRRTEIPASRLLMPLAYGSLLGGLTTLIGTPPNLLIDSALDAAGLQGFSLFDFAPVGLGVMLVGTAFVAFFGRHMLPNRPTGMGSKQRSQRNLRALYGLQERTFMMRIPEDSLLVGKSLAASRIGSAVGLIIVALDRCDKIEALPSRKTILEGGDKLLVQGRLDRFEELRRWGEVVIEREAPLLKTLVNERVNLVEAGIADDSALVKDLLNHTDFRRRFGVNVLAIRRRELVRRVNISNVPLRCGDCLLMQGNQEALDKLERSPEFTNIKAVDEEQLTEVYRLQESVFVIRIPRNSKLGGQSLAKSRLGDAFDFRLLATFRENVLQLMPEPDELLLGGDLMLLQGRPEDLDELRGLQELEIDSDVSPQFNTYESDRLGLLEATLNPQSELAGQSISDINFREKYGLELVAIWRSGQAIRSELDRLTLEFGDALLLIGPRKKINVFSKEQDFIALTAPAKPGPDLYRAPRAGIIMLGVIISVLMGWLPIAIAAVLGATCMVISGCLNMEQAYRAIDWRAVFLIAGMLPLGIAMQDSGTATFVAGQVMSLLGDMGPWTVIAGLYLLTALATMIIPTAALVVLMSPIVLSATAEMGIAPQTAMMAIAMAASASFTSPISHPANILVMGPGGYKFSDYIKLGVPLTLIVFVTVMFLLPIFWPIVYIK